MAKDYIRWDKLDNTANLFPVIAGESMTNTYRISCVLKEEVDEGLLQEALDMVLPKMPGFNLRLRSGIFGIILKKMERRHRGYMRSIPIPAA